MVLCDFLFLLLIAYLHLQFPSFPSCTTPDAQSEIRFCVWLTYLMKSAFDVGEVLWRVLCAHFAQYISIPRMHILLSFDTCGRAASNYTITNAIGNIFILKSMFPENPLEWTSIYIITNFYVALWKYFLIKSTIPEYSVFKINVHRSRHTYSN